MVNSGDLRGTAGMTASAGTVMPQISASVVKTRIACMIPHGILDSIASDSKPPMIIAIDGPAGAGKSTIARSLAHKLGFAYIDTGAMYRAVALWALRVGVDLDDLHRLEQLAKEARIEFVAGEATVHLNGEDVTAAIREPRVSHAASRVSMAPGVRRAMRNEQRRIGSLQPVVMEGRDIGTVVFPEAQVKIYLDAAPEVRAGRRAAETGGPISEIARDLAERDHRDRTRAEAPLTQAPDAEYLDTTGLSPAEVEAAILKLVREKTSNGKGHH
jgi:cytidylate kinase